MTRQAVMGALAWVLVWAPARGADLPRLFGRPVLDRTEYAFNAGDLHRLAAPDWVPVAQREDVRVWVWDDRNWTDPARVGRLVRVRDVVPDGTPLKDAFAVFHAPIDTAPGDEWIWVPRTTQGRDGRVPAPTIVHRDGGRWTVVWRPTALAGLRYRLEDLRDLDGDGRFEATFSGQFGSNGFYSSYAVVGVATSGAWRTLVTSPPDTVHLHDPDKDGVFELVVQHLVSRRGPVALWVTTDRMFRWNGSEFEPDPVPLAPVWYAQVTARRLLDELIDHFDVDGFLLHTRTEVLRQVHARVIEISPPHLANTDPVARATRLERAGRWQQASAVLERALDGNPWDIAVLRKLMRYDLGWKRWGDALELAYRVLGIEPEDGATWTVAAVCFGERGDRTEAVAAFVLAVRLAHDPAARRAHLEALRKRARNPVLKAALDEAFAWLDAHTRPAEDVLTAPPDAQAGDEGAAAVDAASGKRP